MSTLKGRTNVVIIFAFLWFINSAFGLYTLSLHPRLDYQWDVNYERNLIQVKVTYRPSLSDDNDPKDWVAIGFTSSNIGDFNNADFCVFWADWKDNLFLQDVHTGPNDTVAKVDRFQDCQNFQAQAENSGKAISWMFTRAFDTCHDNEDYVIEDGTTHLVWSFGKGPLYELEGLDLTDPDSSSANGFSRVRLLKVDVPLETPEDAKILEVRHQVTIPSDNTTYWCSIHKLPDVFAKKHHVIQYEAAISPGNERFIHHMEVFHCVPPTDSKEDKIFPLWQGPCGSDEAPEKLQRCKKVLAAWAIGAGPFTYPKETGLAMGGPKFDPYIMLEVHLNNEQEDSGVKDGSGLRFLVTETLRPHDAGIMELGLIYTDHMAIPPGQYMFPLHGFCLPACTAVGFPSEGINLFGSQLHTHGTGLRVETRHFRGGQELPEVNRDNHYSTHFQEIRTLREPRIILPGDELVTTCWYDTRRKTNATVGGFTFEDEMCLNYIHYYPRTEDLEICKSSVDPDALDTYFQFLNEWDGQNTDPDDLSVRENYLTIEWTKLRSEKLRKFYDSAPVEMQCSSGAGTPLPGKWTGLSQPPVHQTLPPAPRHSCIFEENGSKFDSETSKQPSRRDTDSEEEERFRKRFWSEEDKRRKRKRSSIDLKRSELKRSWLGRNLDEKKKKRAESFMSEPQPSDFAINEMKKKKKRMDYIISMAKRVGQPMNEMKKRSESAEIVDKDLPRNEMKKKSESILNLVKRVGRPMNEMKKRSEQTISMVKRSGQPMNEMKKKKKRYSDDDEESFSTKADEILTLESELDEALNLLEDVSRLSGEENPLKKRRKRTNEIPNDDQEAEQLVQDLEKQLKRVRELLREMDVQLVDEDYDSLIAKRKKKSDDWDYSDEWSDYDSWGLDRKRKRGLGSMKKKKKRSESVDISI